jgi:hypothetical protein
MRGAQVDCICSQPLMLEKGAQPTKHSISAAHTPARLAFRRLAFMMFNS